jgi:DNA-binding NtrC family response regulator
MADGLLAVLLDDDPDILEVLTDVLADHGYRCKQTRNVRELAGLGDKIHDAVVVVLDVALHDGRENGIDAYRWLKSQSYTGRVCFLTGYSYDHPMVEEILELEHVEVLIKPVSLEMFIKAIGVPA